MFERAEQGRWEDSHLLAHIKPRSSRTPRTTGTLRHLPAKRHKERWPALATILFTDIVGSTEKAVSLGDARWTELLEAHDATARAVLDTFGGRWVRSTGDGIEATFDTPSTAIRCCQALRAALRCLGLEIRAGIHTGEVEPREGTNVGGIAVHIAARVMEEARAGEILVSGSIPTLLLGTGLTFSDQGTRTLRGVPGQWHVYAVDGGGSVRDVTLDRVDDLDSVEQVLLQQHLVR